MDSIVPGGIEARRWNILYWNDGILEGRECRNDASGMENKRETSAGLRSGVKV